MTKTRSVAATANDLSIPGSRLENDAIADSKISPAAGIASSKLSYEPPFAASVARSVEERLSNVVLLTDFGAIEGDDVNHAAANTAAFAAALGTSRPILVPAGTFWVNTIDLSAYTDVEIIGDSMSSTVIKRTGSGATFYSNTYLHLKLRRMKLIGNTSGSSVHHDYSADTGENVFEEVYFQTDDYGLRTECLAVGWTLRGCYFNGMNVAAREFFRGVWAHREYANVTSFCVRGLVVRRSGFSNSLINCVMQDIDQEAVIIDVSDDPGTQIGEWLFESVFFEAIGKTGAHPVINLKTSIVGRLRCVTFDNCIFNSGPHPNPTYICQITQGGGGNVRRIKFRNSFFNYTAVPTTNLNYDGVIFDNNNEFNDSVVGDNRIRSQQLIQVTVPFGNQGRVVPSSATAPADPAAGELYFSITDNKLKCWDGSSWNNLF